MARAPAQHLSVCAVARRSDTPAASVLGPPAVEVAVGPADADAAELSEATAPLERRLLDGAAASAISFCTLSFSARSASTCAMRSLGSVLACAGHTGQSQAHSSELLARNGRGT